VIPKDPVLRMVLPPQVNSAPTPPPKPTAPAHAAAHAVSEIPDIFVPAVPAAAEPAPEEIISIPLASLASGWPETVRSDIVRLSVMSARANLPVNLVEPALKRGKVVFKWSTVRSWIKPAPHLSMSPHDEVIVELPLDVLAPLFLELKRSSGKRTKVAIDENIPDLFFGFPQPESLTSGDTHVVSRPTDTNMIGKEEEPAVVEAIAAPVETAAPVEAIAPVPDTNYYDWKEGTESVELDNVQTIPARTETDFIKRSVTPANIVARAIAFENVAGALIALPDGLMVAGHIPPDLNGDTLAGFVPQIFNKVGLAANELRMGELNNVAFTVGNIPWKIFKVNAVLFAAFGHVGKSMPTAELAALAAELDQKNR
jgi:predicted regulator of Ras-like GTPase activity (Roadblock/LC7/MglB family)